MIKQAIFFRTSQTLALAIALGGASIAHAFEVGPLPDDNLVNNPWFKDSADPDKSSLEGWEQYTEGSSDVWGMSDKQSNPSPDSSLGTATRWAEERGSGCTAGNRSGKDAYFSQVIQANPANLYVKFHTYWVAHKVEVLEFHVYGADDADGDWGEPLWRPFHQVCEQDCAQMVGGDGEPRSQEWVDLTEMTPMVQGQLDKGWAYYKLEGHARYVKDAPNDCDVGAKVTGIYFAANATGEGDIIEPPPENNPDGGVTGDAGTSLDGDNQIGSGASGSKGGGCSVGKSPVCALPLALMFLWLGLRLRLQTPAYCKRPN